MHNIIVTTLALVVVVVECGVFDFKISPEAYEDSEQCREFNQTLYKYVDEILSSLDDEKPAPKIRSKRDTNDDPGTFHTFKLGFKDDPDPFYINIRVPTNITFPYETRGNPISFFLPDFKLERVVFKKYNETFMVTEGTRCSYKCSRKTKRCKTSKCWNRPSACFGDIKKCLNYDSDGECRNMANFEPEPEKYDKDFYTMSSLDFRGVLLIPSQRIFVLDNGRAGIEPEPEYYWKCELKERLQVHCTITKSVAGASLTLLKTIAGYNG